MCPLRGRKKTAAARKGGRLGSRSFPFDHYPRIRATRNAVFGYRNVGRATIDRQTVSRLVQIERIARIGTDQNKKGTGREVAHSLSVFSYPFYPRDPRLNGLVDYRVEELLAGEEEGDAGEDKY